MGLEIFPVVAGAVIGMLVFRFAPQRLRLQALGVASLIAGVLASALAGELEISPAFIIIDVGQVVLVAFLVYALLTLVQRRTSTTR